MQHPAVFDRLGGFAGLSLQTGEQVAGADPAAAVVSVSLVMALSAVAYNGGIPWGPILASLILGNIPTVILLAIYFACREKFRKRSELDKMNISDL